MRDDLDAVARRVAARAGGEAWAGERREGEGSWRTLTVRLPDAVADLVEAEVRRLMATGCDQVNAWEYMAVLSSQTPLESVA